MLAPSRGATAVSDGKFGKKMNQTGRQFFNNPRRPQNQNFLLQQKQIHASNSQSNIISGSYHGNAQAVVQSHASQFDLSAQNLANRRIEAAQSSAVEDYGNYETEKEGSRGRVASGRI